MMKTGAVVVLSLLGAAVVVGSAYVAYKEYEKDECAKNEGTWTGDLLTGSCTGFGVTPVTPGTPAPPTFTTFTATGPDANGNSTVTAAWTSSSGATSYTLTVNSQTVYQGSNLSWTGTVNVGVSATSVTGTIEACN